ncbi:hypothetical protein FB388_5003 [Pseudonocardia cypriaca]|uniref:Uncharacterized protein n=1 Tax=Pseudonocardia cypriaca TaxID=882449 RepID=A0A543FVL6_9PSEU|nr:hypothetical protein FB388_5003 [Pseudonocardia cypriaca]
MIMVGAGTGLAPFRLADMSARDRFLEDIWGS